MCSLQPRLGTSWAVPPAGLHSPGPGPAPTLLPESPAQFQQLCLCPVTVGLPRLDGRAGLQAPILAGCHPSLVALRSKGPGGKS